MIPKGPDSKRITVTAAVLERDGRVLIARRKRGDRMADKWEFPGGKVEPGETPEDALCREIKEELSVDLCRTCLAPFNFASHAYDDFHLLMPLYVCRTWDGEIAPREGQTIEWVRALHLSRYRMPPADEPLIPWLRDYLA